MTTQSTSLPLARPAARPAMIWSGRVITGLAVLFLLFDMVIKVLALPQAIEATVALGYPASIVTGLGLLELACLALYLLPRTAAIGAILMTGYLGGAIATHVHSASPTFSLIFPAIIGALLWGGLLLRRADLRTLLRGERAS